MESTLRTLTVASQSTSLWIATDTPLHQVYSVAGIAPPHIRREVAAEAERERQDIDPRHSLYVHQSTRPRLQSRHSFLTKRPFQGPLQVSHNILTSALRSKTQSCNKERSWHRNISFYTQSEERSINVAQESWGAEKICKKEKCCQKTNTLSAPAEKFRTLHTCWPAPTCDRAA